MRFLGLMLGLAVVFCGAIVVVRQIGNTQSQADLLPELKRCGDDWCVRGGVSPKWRLGEIPQFCDQYICHQDATGAVYVEAGKSGLSLFIQPDDDGFAINLKLDALRQPLLGSWLVQYGVPCSVSTGSLGEALLFYDDMVLVLNGFDVKGKSPFPLDTPVYNIWIYSHKRNRCSGTIPGLRIVPWKGLMSPYRYAQLMALVQ